MTGSGLDGEGDSRRLEEYLHEHIPVTRHMEFEVREAVLERVVLSAPLRPNINHRKTAFGGSVSALAIITGWALVYLRCQELVQPHRIVIQRNEMEYLEPVEARFEATCSAPGRQSWEKMMKLFDRRGLGRIHLEVLLTSSGRTAGKFQGSYVIQRIGNSADEIKSP